MSILLLSTLLFITQPAQAELKVQYGGDEILDACTSLATVNDLGKGADNFLAVKDEPNLQAKRIDKIFKGQKLWICEESKDGQWYGVVYPQSEKADCGVAVTIEKRKAYSGPCKSGWVSKKYVTIVAG